MYRTSVDFMICFSSPSVHPQYVSALVATGIGAHLFLTKSAEEVSQKIVEGQLTDLPVVLISKVATEGSPSFGPDVTVTCRQFIRAERQRPFGVVIFCPTSFCSVSDPAGLLLDVSQRNDHYRSDENPVVNPELNQDPNFKRQKYPFVSIVCKSCRRRANLIMPKEITKLSSEMYRWEYPLTVNIDWRGFDPDAPVKGDEKKDPTGVSDPKDSQVKSKGKGKGKGQATAEVSKPNDSPANSDGKEPDQAAGVKRGRGESTGEGHTIAKRRSRRNLSKAK